MPNKLAPNPTPNQINPPNRPAAYGLSSLCIVTGGVLYLAYRPTSLLMFHWLKAAGLAGAVDDAREILHQHGPSLPAWAVDSLPFGLWCAAYVFWIQAVWGGGGSYRAMWIVVVPAASLLSELLQAMEVLPGHFDPMDGLALILCTFGALALCEILTLKRKEAQS